MKNKSLALRRVLGVGALGICGVMLFSWLTYIPEMASATIDPVLGTVDDAGTTGEALAQVVMPEKLTLSVLVVSDDGPCSVAGANCTTADINVNNPAKITTGTSIEAKVGANVGYVVSIDAADGKSKNLTLEGSTDVIEAAENGVVAGVNGWGIKKIESINTDGTFVYENPSDWTADYYFAIGDSTNSVVFYDSKGEFANGRVLTFPIAVAVKPDIRSGTYSTETVVTLTPKS